MKQTVCPICEEGVLVPTEEMEEATYRGVTRILPLRFSECDVCGSETATPEQTRANKRAMIAFKKEVDGLLTGEQVIALRKRLELTQAQAAKLFGGGPVAFSKYEKDDVTQSESMDKLLRMADKYPAVLMSLAEVAGELELLARIAESRVRKLEARHFVSGELKQVRFSISKEVGDIQPVRPSTPAPAATEEMLDVG